MSVEPDLEKIRAELAESSRLARKKVESTVKSYQEAMNDLAQQLTKLQKRG